MTTSVKTKLLAFHADPKIKRKYLARVRAHAKADEIIHGTYWENGKGCAVGCTIHSYLHANYEDELGIPRILARLEDRLFEGMTNGHAKEFPALFLKAVPVGADLSNVWNQFAHWLLIDERDGVIRFAKKEATRAAILTVGELYGRAAGGDVIEAAVWRKARAAAAAYAAAAYAAAAYDAYYAAYYAAAAAAAYDAAAASAAAYAAAARQAAYRKMADKLVDLMGQAPVAAKAGAR